MLMHCIKIETCKSIHLYLRSNRALSQIVNKMFEGGKKPLSVLSQEEILSYDIFLIRPECVEMEFVVFVFIFRPPRNHKVLEGALCY